MKKKILTPRVPFHVDPGFYGEHNFFIHGIHDIKVGPSREDQLKGKVQYG
jgi:hypothetical protein